MINKNKIFRQIHIYMSLFFLPLALLYAISGIAYILGANQDTGLKELRYESFITVQKGKEQEQFITELQKLNIKLPSDTSLKPDKREGGFSMGGIHYSVSFKQNENKLLITTQTRSLLGDMIMLHKDKGKWYFSLLAIGFALALLMLYLSGLMITLVAMKKDRQKQFFTLALGFVSTLLLAYLSL